MLFWKCAYWAIFIIALIAFFYFDDAPLGYFCLLGDMTLMALPKS